MDAGYDNGNLNEILDVLDEKKVPVSFFITGDFVNRFKELTLRLSHSNHIICNHSYGHLNITKLSDEEIKKDLKKLDDAYYSLTSTSLAKFFRPPAGEFDERSLKVVNNLGYKTVFWSLAYKDWVKTSLQSEQVINEILSHIHNGAIILLHSISNVNKEMLPKLLDKLIQDGYIFKTVNDL